MKGRWAGAKWWGKESTTLYISPQHHHHTDEMNQEPAPPPCQIHGAFATADLAQLPLSSNLDVDEHGVLWLPALATRAAAPAAPAATTDASPPPPATNNENSSEIYDRELLCELMDLRSSFDAVPRSRYSAARWESNPYERLGEPDCNPFLNRSALKLANMNKLMPLTPASSPSSTAPSPVSLTFLDLCGGPGGFSEYLLRRQAPPAEVHGWGMTLEDCDCPWDRQNLASWIVGEDEDEEDEDEVENEEDDDDDDDTPAAKRQKTATTAPKQPTRTLRFCYGEDGRGDLCRPENVQYLRHFLPARVDVVVADGGFAEARARFDQEATMLPLLISEVSAMLYTLKSGGSFVCKFFDVTLPGTVQLVGVLVLLFEKVAIVKPVTSRPASSERYVLGEGFRCGGEEREKEEGEMAFFLSRMLARAQAGQTGGVLKEEEEEEEEEGGVGGSLGLVLAPGSIFVAWLRAVNDRLMRAQIQACYTIHERLDAEEGGAEEEEVEGEEGARREGVDVEACRRAWGLERMCIP